MSDWEPVEPDLPFDARGELAGVGDKSPPDASRSPRVRIALDKEVIQAMFEAQRDRLAFLGHRGAIRSEADTERLLDRREFQDGTAERTYYHYDSSSGQFIGRAKAIFFGADSTNLNSERFKRYLEGGVSIDISFRKSTERKSFNWYGEAVGVRLSFDAKNILNMDTNDFFDIGYDSDGNLVKVENSLLLDDGDLTDHFIIANQYGPFPNQFVSGDLDRVVAGGEEVYQWSDNYNVYYGWEYDQEKEKGFLCVTRYNRTTGESIRIMISPKVNPNLRRELIPLPKFSDPYSAKPRDDSAWLETDWEEILGLHWEHSVPQVKNEDTELPEGK